MHWSDLCVQSVVQWGLRNIVFQVPAVVVFCCAHHSHPSRGGVTKMPSEALGGYSKNTHLFAMPSKYMPAVRASM